MGKFLASVVGITVWLYAMALDRLGVGRTRPCRSACRKRSAAYSESMGGRERSDGEPFKG